MAGAVPENCCGRTDGAGCVCAAEARCSCGKQSALHCNCDKAASENKLPSEACACGMRPKGECTCKGASAGSDANEIDFTGRA